MIVILLGAPGAGKGTQAELLVKDIKSHILQLVIFLENILKKKHQLANLRKNILIKVN